MKKIGLATVYSKINYGTVLQAFATQEIMDELGYVNETIALNGLEKEFNKKKRSYFFRHIFQKNLVSTKIGIIVKQILVMINWKGLKDNSKIRKSCFDEFIYRYFRFSPAFSTLEDLKEYSESYDSIIVGSDQIWLPQHIDTGFYTLMWVPDGVKRISYATSFGTNSIPRDMESKTREYLSLLDDISVREQSGKALIEKISNQEAKIVCDPTLLVSRNKWEELADVSKCKINEKYIFCYFLGKNAKHRKFANYLKEKYDYKIVGLLHLDEYVALDENFTDIKLYDVGPNEFLDLIRNAEFVCTDSFHACIFSIIFHKDFFVFNRFDIKNRLSTNSRLSTLLEISLLNDRLINDFQHDILEESLHSINYSIVDKNLERYKRQSVEYIKKSLRGRLSEN